MAVFIAQGFRHVTSGQGATAGEEFQEILRDKHSEFVLPRSWYVRTIHLCNYVRLMTADHHVHENELSTVEMLAEALQFPPDKIAKLIQAFLEAYEGKRDLGFLLGAVSEWGRSGFTRSHWDGEEPVCP